ncbi:MAG: hypothetical protein ACJ739_00590 [Acidimicrobiales bacterium]
MTSTTSAPKHVMRARRLVAVAVGATLGITGAFTVASAQDDATPRACRASQADLLRAADAARVLEQQRPDLFAQSPRPADYDDLRLAAEWARRLAVLDPDGSCA